MEPALLSDRCKSPGGSVMVIYSATYPFNNLLVQQLSIYVECQLWASLGERE